jgi:D-xylose transport system permease protein
MLLLKVGTIAVVGAVIVGLLSVNRGQGLLAVEGVPIVIPIVLLILVVGTFVLDRTLFGRYIYAVGGNPEAARRAGIKVAQIRLYAFIICSSLAVVSGLLQASRIGSIESTAGREIVLSGVAAAVVGGVSLFGGRGRLAYAAIGALVIAMIDNGLGLIGFPAAATFLITGGVLVAAATVDALSRRRSGVALT